MSKQVLWTSLILDEFERLGGLTDEERMILRTRAAGWTITKQCMEFHMSRSKVDGIIRVLKAKYDAVEPYSTILPKRKASKKELYMDEN